MKEMKTKTLIKYFHFEERKKNLCCIDCVPEPELLEVDAVGRHRRDHEGRHVVADQRQARQLRSPG